MASTSFVNRVFGSLLALSLGATVSLAFMPPGSAEEGPKRIALNGNVPCLGWTREDQQPRAVVLCLHELAMHSGNFEDLGKKLANKGYVTYAIDLRGFGSWQNARGKEKMDLDLTFEDTLATIKAIQKAHPKLPIFVLGEAMGGAMALKVATKYPDLIAGAISSAPGGEHFDQGKLNVDVGARLVTTPNKKFPYGKQFITMGSPNEATRQAFEKDSMVRLQLTPKECVQCQFFMFTTKGMAKKIKTVPVMIVQGEKDGMARPVGAQRVYDRLATKDRKLFMVSDGDHYVYESPDISDNIINTTVSWLDEHLPKAQ